MDEKPITTLGPWSYHNPIDMAADEQSFSVNKEVKWMNEMSDKDLKDMKDYALTELGLIKQGFANAEDAVERGLKRELVLIDNLKECREENKRFKGNQEVCDDGTDPYRRQIARETINICLRNLGKAWAKRHKKIKYETWMTLDSATKAIKAAIDEV